MTTVVPFRQPSPKRQSYLLLTTLVDPNAHLEEGDLCGERLTPPPKVS